MAVLLPLALRMGRVVAAPMARLGGDADTHGHLRQRALFVVHALAQRFSIMHSLIIAAYGAIVQLTEQLCVSFGSVDTATPSMVGMDSDGAETPVPEGHVQSPHDNATRHCHMQRGPLRHFLSCS